MKDEFVRSLAQGSAYISAIPVRLSLNGSVQLPRKGDALFENERRRTLLDSLQRSKVFHPTPLHDERGAGRAGQFVVQLIGFHYPSGLFSCHLPSGSKLSSSKLIVLLINPELPFPQHRGIAMRA